MLHARLASLAFGLLGFGGDDPSRDASGVASLDALLEPIRAKHDVPALGGAIVEGDRLVAIGAVGARKLGAPERATADDLWHLGSCTKSMTATLLAIYVERGALKWTTTVGEIFGDSIPKMDPAWRAVTIEQLVTHRAGAPNDLNADGLWGRLWTHVGTGPEQRLALVEGVVARPPVSKPGTEFLYSNAGFAIAGAMLEKKTGEAWETLMRRELWAPLGIAAAGFGAPGTQDKVDQPRGHAPRGGAAVPIEVGPGSDNPAAIGPAGTVHMSLRDWSKYVALHLRGEREGGKLLKPETFRKLHAPADGKDDGGYAMGWGVTKRPWGDGVVLSHNGSNTMWFAVTWLAPKKDFAVLVTTNQGGEAAAKATDEAASALILEEGRRRSASRPAASR